MIHRDSASSEQCSDVYLPSGAGSKDGAWAQAINANGTQRWFSESAVLFAYASSPAIYDT